MLRHRRNFNGKCPENFLSKAIINAHKTSSVIRDPLDSSLGRHGFFFVVNFFIYPAHGADPRARKLYDGHE